MFSRQFPIFKKQEGDFYTELVEVLHDLSVLLPKTMFAL